MLGVDNYLKMLYNTPIPKVIEQEAPQMNIYLFQYKKYVDYGDYDGFVVTAETILEAWGFIAKYITHNWEWEDKQEIRSDWEGHKIGVAIKNAVAGIDLSSNRGE